jgi:hypothetical protein
MTSTVTRYEGGNGGWEATGCPSDVSFARQPST